MTSEPPAPQRDAPLEITDAPRAIMRHPSDLQRLMIALFVGLIGFLLATYLNTIGEAFAVEVINGVGTLPNTIVILAIITIDFFALAVPVTVIGFLMWTRQWRKLGVASLAAAIAVLLAWLIEAELVSRFSAGDLPYSPPTWLCTGPTETFGLACVEASRGWGTVLYSAAFAAFFSAVSPYLTTRWRRFGWIMMGVLVFARMIDGLKPPVDDLLVLALGYSVGAATLLVLGAPDRRPRMSEIAASLGRSGFDLSTLAKASVDARGSTPYFATTTDGDRLFVKVLTPEERAGDNMFRVFRMARLKGVGDERPFSSLKRAVEHEAVVSLKASADGVRTPRLEAIAEIEPNSVVMAYRVIDGSSLDGVPDDALTDEVIQGVWSQVGVMRQRRTAHRDLRLANVFLDDAATPWIIDFGFSELAATDGQLRSDIAELLVSTAEKTGAERSVANAIAILGPEPIADAAQRVQPLALSGATREALKEQKGLDSEVRDQIAVQTGTEPSELEDLERVKGKTVLMILGFTLAIYFLIPQLAQTDFGAVLGADWKWLPAILIASSLTYVGAAWNVMGSVPDRIRLLPTVLAQFAGTFINRITPVKVGGMATNVRYLQKSGVETPVAVAGIGVSSVGTFLVHMSLLVMFVVFVGRNAGDFIELPSGQTVLVGMVAVFTVAIGAWFLPAGRRILKDTVWPIIRRSGMGIVQVATSPKNAIMLFGGAFVLIMSYITALWFSLEAFGGGLTFVGVGVVFLAGQALGQAAPTPGGIGATEAAMIAAMTALGLEASIAVPTVFLYRIATFWLPILPGFLALRKLETDGAL